MNKMPYKFTKHDSNEMRGAGATPEPGATPDTHAMRGAGATPNMQTMHGSGAPPDPGATPDMRAMPGAEATPKPDATPDTHAMRDAEPPTLPRPRMPLAQRAKIFIPFDPLKGYQEALGEKEREAEARMNQRVRLDDPA